jgi:peptidyl-tRNA hydrolase
MEQQQQTKGIGKESQLSKIAAAVNPGSMAEANPTATQSMISTFMQTFESSALEMREETNDDQKALIKTMIEEITKLQTKNMKEFEKAIGKIVGITQDLQNSDNPLLQKLGKEMEEKSREEVVKASGYTLTGEKDTFLNRLGRSVGMNTDEEPVEKNREGIGKLAKGFASNIGGTLKRGFNIAVGREAPEGSFADNVFTSDEQKRERLLSRVDAESNETQSTNATDTFKKVIEEYFKEEKKKSESSEKSALTEEQKKLLSEIKDRRESVESTQSIVNDKTKQLSADLGDETKTPEEVEKSTKELDEVSEVLRQKTEELTAVMDKYEASVGTSKSPTINSEAQEDAAGISKDATIEALQKTADSNVLIQEYSNTTQEKTTETVDVLKEILELMKKMSSDNQSGAAGGDGGDGGDGGGMDIDLPDRRRGPRRSRGRVRARARMASRGIRGRVGGLARGLVSGARTVGSAILSGGARTIGMLGLGTAGAAGAAGLGTAGAAGAAGLGTAGAAGAAGLGTAGAAGAAGLGTAGAAGLGAAGATGAASLGATGATGAAGTAAAATKSTGFLGKIASGASSLGSKAGSVLSKASPGLVKGLGFAGRVAGKLALPLAAGMAAYDGYKGFNADPNATTGQKFKNAGRNVLSGLTFGLVDSTEDKMAAGEYTGTQKGAVEKPSGGGFFSRNKGMVAGAALGPAGMVAGAAYDKMAGNKGSTNIEPKAKENTGNFFSKNAGLMAGAALGPAGMVAGAAYDKMSSSKAETGKNIDGALIEQGTEATKEKIQINVPPPTVINQGAAVGQAPPQLTFPGGVGNVRSNDPTWLMFQKRRAVA